ENAESDDAFRPAVRDRTRVPAVGGRGVRARLPERPSDPYRSSARDDPRPHRLGGAIAVSQSATRAAPAAPGADAGWGASVGCQFGAAAFCTGITAALRAAACAGRCQRTCDIRPAR